MPNLIEALEGRTFLSVTPAASLVAAAPAHPAVVVQPLANAPIGGTYNGTLSVLGLRFSHITLSLARRSATRFVGTLSDNLDPSFRLHVVMVRTGTGPTGNRLMTLTLSGQNDGVTITGSGSAVITLGGRLRSSSVTFFNNGFPFTGSIVLTHL
jgi:hypothetical protein